MMSNCNIALFAVLVAYSLVPVQANDDAEAIRKELNIPSEWEYSEPLVSAEKREHDPSRAQKDPTIVYHDSQWHLFVTVKLPGRSAIEYSSFADWPSADKAKRTILTLSDIDYFCAPQVFYFRPHQLWYLVYQVGVPGNRMMWVAYSTTKDIADPTSWTPARPMLDGGEADPRTVGGLDYWIICDEENAFLFFTSLNGKMWRMKTPVGQFPSGFDHCEVALQAEIFEASHTYRVKGSEYYLTFIEQKGQRYFKAYLSKSLDGEWIPIADSSAKPFAGNSNCQPRVNVERWTDNISHGELLRASNDERLMIDPNQWQLLFQGCLQSQKASGYGAIPWRLGLLTPARE